MRYSLYWCTAKLVKNTQTFLLPRFLGGSNTKVILIILKNNFLPKSCFSTPHIKNLQYEMLLPVLGILVDVNKIVHRDNLVQLLTSAIPEVTSMIV